MEDQLLSPSSQTEQWTHSSDLVKGQPKASNSVLNVLIRLGLGVSEGHLGVIFKAGGESGVTLTEFRLLCFRERCELMLLKTHFFFFFFLSVFCGLLRLFCYVLDPSDF